MLSLSPLKMWKRRLPCAARSHDKKDYLSLCEDGTVVVGLTGEKLLKSFKFYAVFKDSEDYSVKCGSDEIGTISSPVPVGDRFALAGRVWEVEELDLPRKLIFVHNVPGKWKYRGPEITAKFTPKCLKNV